MRIALFEVPEREREFFRHRLSGHELSFHDEPLAAENLPDDREVEAVAVFTRSRVTREVIGALPKLRLVVTQSTGYDHIDLAAAVERGVAVCNVPSYGERTVAEYTFALLLAVSRKIYQAYHRVRESGSFSTEGLQGVDLFGKTIGVVGTGKIGRNVIRIAKGFEMEVIACDPHPSAEAAAELGFVYTSLEELLGRSDVVTLHLPLTKETHHLIHHENIRGVKRGAILINTSRGGVVDTDALVNALEEGILSGAGLDVLEEEGAMKDEREVLLYGRGDLAEMKTALENHILIDMENVVITPHNAFNTKEAEERIMATSAENILAFAAGKAQNTVQA